MKKGLWLCAGWMIAGLWGGGAAFAVTGSQQLFSPRYESVMQSVLFVDADDGKVLFEAGADQLLAPASVAKLVTSAASLYELGPHYSFKTNFYTTGSRRGHQINGDLVVKASGDPLLISEKLWQVAADIRHLGIRTITGDIIIDDSIFDDHFRDDSRRQSKLSSRNAYDAPLSAFGVNFNTYTIALAPSEKPGTKAIAELDPYPLRNLVVVNKTTTSKVDYGSRLQVSRKSSSKDAQMVVSGQIGSNEPLKKVYRSVGDPIKAAGEQLRAFLNKEGVIVQGQAKRGLLPKGATFLTSLEGYPLKRIIESLNKYSNNYIADTLVKVLSHKRSGREGSLDHGLSVIRDFLVKDVAMSGPFVLKNGSGLDPDNRLSARQIVQVLRFMHKRFDLYPEYLNSLPSSGFDGTLKDRFRQNSQQMLGLVRAKTGTLTSPVTVAGLAGYLNHPKYGLVAFAILENGKPQAQQPNLMDLRARQDRAIQTFINM